MQFKSQNQFSTHKTPLLLLFSILNINQEKLLQGCMLLMGVHGAQQIIM